jgi:hypothetical protein
MKSVITMFKVALLMPAFFIVCIDANSQPLTGNKTVGAGGNYSTLSLAVNALNINGVGSGGVTFMLTDASYQEPQPLTISASGTSSALVTFKPAAGVSPKITISAVAASQWGIKLDGADCIVFEGSNNGTETRDLAFELAGTHGSVFYLTNSADNNTIRNCSIKSFANDSTADIGILIKGAGCDSTLIQNNHIFNAFEGIDIFAPGSSGISYGTRILNNRVGDSLMHISTYGIYCAYSQNLQIIGNEVCFIIRDKKSNSPEGIFVPTVVNQVLRIEKNKIHDLYSTCVDGMGGKGIYLMLMDNNPNISIINNMIWHLGTGISHTVYSTIDTYAPVGIYMYRSSTNITSGAIKIQHNSIYLTPDNVHGLNPNMAFAMGMYIGVGIGGTTIGSGVIEFRNNMIQINIGESGAGFTGSEAYGIYSASTTRDPFAAGKLDYNIYYYTGQDNNFAGRFMPITSGLSFAQWKAATGQDAHSLNQDPMFNSVFDIHVQDGYFTNGINLGVPGDIDGNPRSNPPDIGADEYDIYTTASPSGKETGVRIFPNPATDILHIVTSLGSEKTTVFIYDIQSRLLLSGEVSNGSTGLDISMLKAGIYYLSIFENNSRTMTKFVKQ